MLFTGRGNARRPFNESFREPFVQCYVSGDSSPILRGGSASILGGRLEEHTVKNVVRAFEGLVELVVSGRASNGEFLAFLDERVAHLNESREQGGKGMRPPVKGLGQTTFYSILNEEGVKKRGPKRPGLSQRGAKRPEINQWRILKRVRPEVFRILLEFNRRYDIEEEATHPVRLEASAFSSFHASEDDAVRACKDLPGFYRTYRPSLSKEGWLVVGLLRVIATPEQQLQTVEYTIYRPDSDAEEFSQLWNGQMWYADEHCLLIASDNGLPRIQILAVQNRDRHGRVFALRGSYSGHSSERGLGIIASRIYIRRLEEKEPTHGPVLNASLGHKHVDAKDESKRISPDLWNRVFPADGKPIVTY